MTSMITLFPTSSVPTMQSPSFVISDDCMAKGEIPSLQFYMGDAYLSIHNQSPEMVRKFAAHLVEAAEMYEARQRKSLADNDAANRTPDANLDPSERDDQPEEVEKNRVLVSSSEE